MPDYRKPPAEKSGRPESAQLPADGGFSIESTTMRLKSLKLRRAEAADRALDEQLRAAARDSVDMPVQRGPAGRVRHDERGVAVWDWAVASGEYAKLSASSVMRKLDVADLKIEETQRSLKAMKPEAGRDAGGGSDPYNQRAGVGGNPYDQRGSTQRPAPTVKRPAPAAAPPKPGNSVLDQLTGRKK